MVLPIMSSMPGMTVAVRWLELLLSKFLAAQKAAAALQ